MVWIGVLFVPWRPGCCATSLGTWACCGASLVTASGRRLGAGRHTRQCHPSARRRGLQLPMGLRGSRKLGGPPPCFLVLPAARCFSSGRVRFAEASSRGPAGGRGGRGLVATGICPASPHARPAAGEDHRLGHARLARGGGCAGTCTFHGRLRGAELQGPALGDCYLRLRRPAVQLRRRCSSGSSSCVWCPSA